MSDEYECPACGAALPRGARFCVECDAELDRSVDEVDELLEEISASGEGDVEPPDDGEAPQGDAGGKAEPLAEEYECPECGATLGEGAGSCPDCGTELYYDEDLEEEAGEEPAEPSPEDSGEEATPPVAEARGPPSAARRRLSLAGTIFAILAMVCVVGLLVVLNYDTWIAGETENQVGDTQVMYVYLATAAMVACVAVFVVDLVRNRGGTTS